MRAITLNNFGGPEVLILSEIPQPIPGPEQLLVHVKAFALNRADLLQRRGKYPPPPGESDILGMEIAGQVVAMGSAVKDFGIGEKVFGLVGSGAYAEYCLIDQGMAMPIPLHLSYEQAAAIPEAFLTAQEAVFTLGELQKNQSILIHAGASGVGSAAIQLAKQVHATVFTTTGSSEKITQIKNFGADAVLNYKEQDFAAEILRLTNNRGVNVIVDFVGAKYFSQHMQILQRDGHLTLVGMMGGSSVEFDLDVIRRNQLQIKGLAMRTHTIAEKRQFTAQFKKHWLHLFEKGKLKPVVDSVFDMTEIRAAHERMENNLNVGKIVVTVD